MISVIDMPPPDESIWWRGKRGFEVGFFPCEYVEVIGDKVPQGLNLPMGANHRLNRKDSVSSEDETDKGSPTSEPTKPVLRKHGKLISFFRSFILSRPARGKLKKSGILKERVFGCDLSEHLLSTGQDVPKVLTHCAEFIEAKGIIDGIYRLSGIASNIQKLRVAFDEDRVPNLYDDKAVLQDIHSVSSLLKMYFRELPNPVCTYHLYEKFVEAAKAPENQRLVLMRDVVQQLPPPYYRTLEYLSRHLYRVSLRGNDTGMTAKNVAIVWAPNLLRAKNLETGGVAALQGVGVQAVVTEYLIRYCELIFSDKMPSYNSSSNPSSILNETDKKLRPKSLAISTPTKLLSLDEARQRLGPVGESSAQKYIEVGGGPKSLPQKYHTVIDLPSRRSMKKSPMGWKSIFKPKSNQKNGQKNRHTIDLINSQNGQSVTDQDLRSALPRATLRPVKSAESLVTASNVQRSQSERRSSRTINVPEASNERPDSSMMESKDDLGPLEAVSQAIQHRDSPRTHNRSSSHDSYFERQHLLRRSSEDEVKMDSSLDLSEIQVNFDLEENEMKIFSEDEAMMTNSMGSSEDLNKSPLVEEQVDIFRQSTTTTNKKIESPRKISFREKLKRFTSPTPNRKELQLDSNTDQSSSDGGCGSGRENNTPPLKKTEKTLREKIVCALSPESLRKRDTSKLDNQISPKKKKSTFSPGTSPNNTSQLIKRSKIEDEEDEEVPLEDKEIRQEIPLSPSINFIDASMTESFESTKIKGETKVSNARFSTASSIEGEEQLQLDQLVVAQVHHDPIHEKRVEEEEEISDQIENIEHEQIEKAEVEGCKDQINEDSTQNTESYSIAGATVSENESFSLASVEDVEMPPEAGPATSLTIESTQPSSSKNVTSEAISEVASMLPANHVIQYSPRLASNSKWSPRPQQYLLHHNQTLHHHQDPHVQDYVDEPMEVDSELTGMSTSTTAETGGSTDGHDSISCPLYPRETSLVTCAEVQLDHDQNLNNAGEGDLKGDINNPPILTVAPALESALTSGAEEVHANAIAAGPNVTPTYVMTTTSPEPRPRTKSFVTPNSSSSKSADMDSYGPKRTPVPTPRKSVTLMEVEPPSENNTSSPTTSVITPNDVITNISERSQSAQGGSVCVPEKKISFGGIPTNQPVCKKLSTFSLHTTSEVVEVVPEDAPLQRRNSIHNVPYVDVNDPRTRERMERYKEERRSMLRAKYKVEDYMTSEANNKYRRKSTESNVNNTTASTSNDHENTTTVSKSIDKNLVDEWSTNTVQLRKESTVTPPVGLRGRTPSTTTTENAATIQEKKNSSPIRETGLIEEDVNVKERAAIFGVTKTTTNNRSKSWLATTNNLNKNQNKNEINKRPMSESHATSRKLSPGSPSKIRDMAALFEQKN